MKKYIEYIINFQCNNIEEVKNWINTNLSNYLLKNVEVQDDIEHILDYLCSDKAPKRLKKMAYKEAKSNSEKWLKTLIKKGKKIKEEADDIEIILEQNKGFKWVKLLTDNAYTREGTLMRHCVGGGGYYNKNI